MIHKLILLIGAGMMIGIGLNGFIIPHQLLDGGVVGMSLLLSYLWGIKPGLTFLVINLAIYLAALAVDRLYFFQGLLGVIISSVMIDLLSPLSGSIHLPIIISSIIGGLFIGIGVGIMLRYEISHDGIDLLALWAAKYISLNSAVIIFICDLLIIGSGLVLFKEASQIYSFLTISVVGIITYLFTFLKSVELYIK